MARDLAARLGVRLHPARVDRADGWRLQPGCRLRSRSSTPTACGRFVARVLRDVTIGPSPTWLANRLTQAGMRPISNVVDVSNYVMLELGQPNHAYDLDKVAGGRLRVRLAHDGEQLVTLDDVERSFLAADVLICDGEDTPIGIAGVMGGASTEISDATTNVLLEVAWWHPMPIARTSTRLNLRSEASRRFERGTDIWGLDLAVERFCSLLAETGAVAAPDVIDERGDVPEHPPIRVRTDRVNLITGLDLDAPTIRGLLVPIGFTVGEEADGAQVVDVPSFRPDVVEEIDVIEEVARHHGYAKLPQTVPLSPHTGSLTERQKERRRLRATLVGLGLDEALPMPFLAPEDLARTGLADHGITVTNPLDAQESIVRPSLRPGLLRGAGLQRQSTATTGRACSRSARSSSRGRRRGAPARARAPRRRPRRAGRPRGGRGLDGGRRSPLAGRHHAGGGGDGRPAPHSQRTAGDRRGPGRRGGRDRPGGRRRLGHRRAGGLAGGRPGRPGRRCPGGTGSTDRSAASRPATSTWPSWSTTVVPAGAVEATIREAAGELLVRLRLFDVFRGDAVGDGRRSLAYALRLQATDRTLTDGEVAEIRQGVIDAVESTHGARLRG